MLILPRSSRAAQGLNVLIGFKWLRLTFKDGGHIVDANTILGHDDKELPPGMLRDAGGWLLTPPPGGDDIILKDPTAGNDLFSLEGRGAKAEPATLELFAKNIEIDVTNADDPSRPVNGKRKAILKQIFAAPYNPEGKEEFCVGRGEIWQERPR